MSRVSLTDVQELLHRQVHPEFDKNGQLSSQIFHARSPAEVSVNRGSLIDGEGSFRLAVSMGFPKTCGCCSVDVGECISIELAAFEDPIDGNSAHAFIDMEHLTRKQRESAAKRLLDFARPRFSRYS